MMACNVRTVEDALNYITDCNLATVSDMAMKKSRPKHEFERQINIAQKAVTWMVEMKVDLKSCRAEEIVKDFEGSVEKWAEQYKPKEK